MEYIDLKFISDIKDDLDIVEIISNYISTYQQDEKYIAVCPFHDTSEKTLTIYPNTQTYYCSECKCHGDVLTFIRNYEHVSFEETMDIANRLARFENLNNSLRGDNGGELITYVSSSYIYNPSLGKAFVKSYFKYDETDKKMLYINLKKHFENNFDDNVETAEIYDIDEIKNKCKDKITKNLSIVVIDYLQLVTSSKNFENDDVKKDFILNELKTLAKELNVPIVVLYELDENFERNKKKITLFDVDSIDKYSDKIIYLDADEYWEPRYRLLKV